MNWINSLLNWTQSNNTLLWWLFAVSVAAFVLTPVAVAWILTRLPPDYFAKEERRPLGAWATHPALRIVVLIAKNLLGIVLLVAGIAMLLVPGQGLLTIAVGLILTDFPGKFRIQRWVVTRTSVWRSINWLRKRAGREPLKRPASA
ncbi:MAG: hypothetical protein L0228_18320 [Planctomycetes bacterium]|nr:hypothetical protein [Planctomycetota bacterium]